MRLPVWPNDSREIIDEGGVCVGFIYNKAARDYIIKATNCHKKLVELLTYAYYLPMNDAGDYDENIKWQKETKQALKAEKK